MASNHGRLTTLKQRSNQNLNDNVMEREGGLKEIPIELWESRVHLGNSQTEAKGV